MRSLLLCPCRSTGCEACLLSSTLGCSVLVEAQLKPWLRVYGFMAENLHAAFVQPIALCFSWLCSGFRIQLLFFQVRGTDQGVGCLLCRSQIRKESTSY